MPVISRSRVRAELSRLSSAGFPNPATLRVTTTIAVFLANNPRVHEPGVRARKTIKHLGSAWRYQDSHPDSTVRQAARKLVRMAGHPVPFEKLEERARKFFRLLQTVGHNRKNQIAMDGAERRRVGKYGYLWRITCKAQLRSIGKQLALCVSGMGYAGRYFRDVEDGDTELWAYFRGDALYALIKVCTNDRNIDECQTHDGETPTFKAREARAILAALNATGDDEEAFACVGAYSVFGGEKPPKTKVFALDSGRTLRLWRYPTEIIAATHRTEEKGCGWSRFYLEDDRWGYNWNNSMRLGELLQLVFTRPDIRKTLGVLD